MSTKQNKQELQKLNEEIELKIKLDNYNFHHLQEWLQLNATYIGKTEQEDYYFDNPGASWCKLHPQGYQLLPSKAGSLVNACKAD